MDANTAGQVRSACFIVRGAGSSVLITVSAVMEVVLVNDLMFLLLLLGCIGITLIITRSKIFFPIRLWLCDDKPNRMRCEFIRCSQCVGFWVGALLFSLLKVIAFGNIFADEFAAAYTILQVILFGAAVSVSSLLVQACYDRLVMENERT